MIFAANTVSAADSEVVSLNLAESIELALKNNHTIAQSVEDREEEVNALQENTKNLWLI